MTTTFTKNILTTDEYGVSSFEIIRSAGGKCTVYRLDGCDDYTGDSIPKGWMYIDPNGKPAFNWLPDGAVAMFDTYDVATDAVFGEMVTAIEDDDYTTIGF